MTLIQIHAKLDSHFGRNSFGRHYDLTASVQHK